MMQFLCNKECDNCTAEKEWDCHEKKNVCREKDGTLDFVAEHCDFHHARHTLTHKWADGREKHTRGRGTATYFITVLPCSAYSLFEFSWFDFCPSFPPFCVPPVWSSAEILCICHLVFHCGDMHSFSLFSHLFCIHISSGRICDQYELVTMTVFSRSWYINCITELSNSRFDLEKLLVFGILHANCCNQHYLYYWGQKPIWAYSLFQPLVLLLFVVLLGKLCAMCTCLSA